MIEHRGIDISKCIRESYHEGWNDAIEFIKKVKNSKEQKELERKAKLVLKEVKQNQRTII